MARIIGAIFLIALLLLGISFSTLNGAGVTVNYYFGSHDLPLSFAIIMALSAGALFGLVGSVGMVVRLRRRVSQLKKSVRSAEREVTQLRAISVKE